MSESTPHLLYLNRIYAPVATFREILVYPWLNRVTSRFHSNHVLKGVWTKCGISARWRTVRYSIFFLSHRAKEIKIVFILTFILIFNNCKQVKFWLAKGNIPQCKKKKTGHSSTLAYIKTFPCRTRLCQRTVLIKEKTHS